MICGYCDYKVKKEDHKVKVESTKDIDKQETTITISYFHFSCYKKHNELMQKEKTRFQASMKKLLSGELSEEEEPLRLNTIYVDKTRLGEYVPIMIRTDDDLLSTDIYLTYKNAKRLYNDLRQIFQEEQEEE